MVMKIKLLIVSCLVFGLCGFLPAVKAVESATVYVTDTVYVCENAFPFHYADTVFYLGTLSGNYVVNINHVGGMDSVVALTLYVSSTYSGRDTLTLCQSDLPYQYGNMTVSATMPTGTYNRVLFLQTVHGCDSIINLMLTIFPSYTRAQQIQICESDLPYTFGGRVLTTAGTYRISLQTAHGCDSVINLSLSANPSYALYDTVKVCPTAFPYRYGTRLLASEGDYRVDASTVKGCDSVVFLHLESYNYPLTYDTLHLCASALPYRYGNTYIPNQGSWDVPLVSVKGGCDSLVRVQVYTEPKYRHNHYIYVCSNDFPYTYGDQTIWDSGYYEINMHSVYGCDSIIDLHVSVAEPHSVVFHDTVCQGDGYNRYGFVLPPSATFLPRLTIYGRRATIFGCDSNITIHIVFTPVYKDTDRVEICETLLPYKKHGRVFNRAGDYLLPFQTIHGCDSTILFSLRTTKVYHVDMTAHFCAGEGSYQLGDSVFTKEGDYMVVMSTQSGCDSVISLHLVKDERAPYYAGEIYSKKDLYQTDKQTFWISAVPNASTYHWSYTNTAWRVEGRSDDYILALRNMQESDTGTVSVEAVNACGVSQASVLKIGTSGISEMELVQARVFPNPTDNQVTVEVNNASVNRVELYDVNGRKLLAQPVVEGKATLSLEPYAPGIYLLRLQADNRLLQTVRVVRK